MPAPIPAAADRYRRRLGASIAGATVALLLVCVQAGEAPAGPGISDASNVAVPPASSAGSTPSDRWYAPLKNIEAGPGALDIGVDLRTRYEYLDEFTVLGYGTGAGDDVLLFRARLSFDYRLSDSAHALVEFQDARYWLNRLSRSDFGRTCTYYDEADLRQAYFEWKRIGASPLGVKLGRQIFLYGDRRLFAPAEWGNVGNYWWDAAKFYCDTDIVRVDAFYARRVLSEPEDWNFDHWPYHAGGIYARVQQLPVTLDAFYVVKHDWSGHIRGERGTGDEQRHSFGVFSERPAGQGGDYGLFAVGQLGKYGRDDIRAFGIAARGGYTFDAEMTPRIGLELNYASGDRDPDDGVAGSFDGVFGAMDLPYGWMNVVSWKNLEDGALNVSVKPAAPLTLGLEYHYFRLARSRDAWYWASGKPERRDRTGDAGRDLGHELDVIGRWQVNRELEVLAGYARFFAGRFVRDTPGGRANADWVFLQVTYLF
ncbi:MAG TPA: hypothetical protein DCM87_13620 [Planctomycetes bacterium]|nr:hypothetical protein [Planctomycetota bacterium]